jgi:hypothetical protein
MRTVEVLTGHGGSEMLHCSMFVPVVSPFTEAEGLVGLAIVPPPLITDHEPVPDDGTLPESIA